MNTYKLCLIGEGGVGKSTFVRKHLDGTFEKKYVATLGVEVHPLRFDTTLGPICFNMWDCAGQEKFGGLRDGYYIQGQACIVMFDKTSLHTMKRVAIWVRDFARVVGVEAPIAIVGAKCDLSTQVSEGEIHSMLVKFGRVLPKLAYFEISTKNNEGLNAPLLWIHKQMVLATNQNVNVNEIKFI